MALTPLLVDAKKEYMHQLADVLMPYVMNTVARIYDAAQKKEKVFRELLRQVPNWNASNIDERTHEIERRCPQLQDLIAACCVSYTKVLGSIRLNQSQHSNVRVSLPQSSTFVHGVYIYVAKEFFYDPKLIYATRTTKMNLMRDAVDESTRQHVPMQQLLKAYLSVAVDDSGLDPMAAAAESGMSPPMSPPMQQQQQFTQADLQLEQQLLQLQQQQQMQQQPIVMEQPPQQPLMMSPQPQMMMQPPPQQHMVIQQQPQQQQQQPATMMIPQQQEQQQPQQQQFLEPVDFFGGGDDFGTGGGDTADFN